MSQPRFPPGVGKHPWGPMVGILAPLKRGCGQFNYVGLGCRYSRHREDSHPMCGGSWNCTCIGYVRSSD
jgi:hypothetical protein